MLAIERSLWLNIQMQRFLGMLPLAVFAVASYAQAPTGEIAGTVYDPSGGAVPNASIKVKSAATAFERVLLSNQSGQYSVPSLTASTYEMRVEAPGFHTYSVQAVKNRGVGNLIADLAFARVRLRPRSRQKQVALLFLLQRDMNPVLTCADR